MDHQEEYNKRINTKKEEKDNSRKSGLSAEKSGLKSSWSAPKDILDDDPNVDSIYNHHSERTIQNKREIASRENEYQSRRRYREFSPERKDPFSKKNGSAESRSYSEIMRESQLEKETHELLSEALHNQNESEENGGFEPSPRGMKRSSSDFTADRVSKSNGDTVSEWDDTDLDDSQKYQNKRSRWDETPIVSTESQSRSEKSSRWDQTPSIHSTSGKSGSRWDETPSLTDKSTDSSLSSGSETPASVISSASLTPSAILQMRADREMARRNKPWTMEDLDAVLPKNGYKILEAPPDYQPVKKERFMLPKEAEAEFYFQDSSETHQRLGVGSLELASDDTLPLFKPEDVQYFGKLLEKKDEESMSLEEAKERKIMRLLVRIKNGNPQMRKTALKQMTEKAVYFGAGPLFNQILPLFMSPTLEDQERHILVKVIDRILFKLDSLVRPYVHKILVVIEPLLIDEDYYARIEGREIISNLSKAAGLATMISTMRPDIDHVDEYVRNTTARAFSVVGSALGISSLLPFLKAVCLSKKSWQARHTGIKIIQQIAILTGCGILPYLRSLVGTIGHGLVDEHPKVRTITALALAALAESSAPYGIESFDDVLRPLWDGIRRHRGKALAAFLKAIGFIIPLMDAEYANKYSKGIMPVIIREFQTPDEEMKKIVLKVVKQCASTDGVDSEYLRKEVLPDFFKYFWVRRMSLDRRNYRSLVEATVELSFKVGCYDIVAPLVKNMKDEAEEFRKMSVEAVDKTVALLGTVEIDERLEKLLVDGLLYAFQEHTSDDFIVLDAFGRIANSLSSRIKPYLPQICSVILWRLNNKNAQIRQHSAELIARISFVLYECGEEKLLLHMGQVLHEYLGEEFPEVLASILAGITGIIDVVGMKKMNPPVEELLPRLTPILKNRHEKVSENVINLVGRIADKGAECASAREWMRICFELLEMLKAHKKSIRRAAIKTFGFIARAIGPQDVLATLLNNLKVQERQYRVCTTIAIAIVAETCAPFTVLPAMMNEYRLPELNVQNGILKSLAFMFEYIGEMSKDYIYAITPLLEDALIDRDLVHRQTACAAVKHLAVSCAYLDREDSLVHLLNLVWPNIFENAPHMINACMEAIEGMRICLGSGVILFYLLQGLFHPARKVREAYWRVYNMIYMGSQDSLVPFYPRIPANDPHSNTVSEDHFELSLELDLVL